MLGKVFENLLEAVSRKSLGTFYTPREIVHYMCQESLISYLYTAVNTGVASLVPAKAVQGGLFGQQQAVQAVLKTSIIEKKVARDDLAALVHLGDQAAHYETALKAGTTSYEKKARPRLPKPVETFVKEIDAALRDIAVCDPAIGSGAFPVGMMTEIVRARLALNPYFQKQEDRTAYHFKRHSIQNSIYGVDIDLGAVEIAKLRLWLSLVVDEEDLKVLKPLPNLDFKIVSGNSLLGFRFVSLGLTEIEQLKAAYFDQPDHDQKAALKETIAKRIATHIAQSEKALGYRVEFDYRLFFSEVFAKRGGFDVVIANPPYVDSERMTVEQPEMRNIYTQTFSAAKGNWDLFIVFIEQGMRQLNSGGIISYIVPNKLLGAPYADAMRELLRKRTVLEIRDYSSVNVFKEAAVYPIVFRASMEGSGRPAPTMTVMSDLEEIQQSRSVPEDVFYADTSWDRYFGTEDDFAIVMKIAAFPSLVGQCKEVTAAATVSDAYEVKTFVIESGAARGRHFKKLVNTGTIDRYELLWGQQPTRYIKASYQTPIVPDAELGAMSKKRLQQAGSSKIIIGGMNKVLECGLDETGEYCAGKSTTIILDDDLDHLKFLLGVLNSKVVTFWYRNHYKSMSLAGGYLRINQREIKTIPVPKPSPAHKRQVIRLVEKMMVATQKKLVAEVAKLDDALEEEIGSLYGLTTVELGVIRVQHVGGKGNGGVDCSRPDR